MTSAYGTSGFTEEHLAAFKRHKTERVLIAYDRDGAGDAAAAKLAPQLISEGIECFRILFAKGMDANEYALKVQPAAKSLGLAIRKAVWLGKGEAPKLQTVAPALEASVAIDAVTGEESHAFAGAVSSLAADSAAKEKNEDAALADARTHAPEASPALALPASPMPQALGGEPVLEIRPHEILIAFGEGRDARRYRVRGLAKNLSFEVLKINLLASKGDGFYVDTFDLFNGKSRAAFIAQTAAELGVSEDIAKRDLGAVRMALEKLQDERIRKSQEPDEPAHPDMTEPERATERVNDFETLRCVKLQCKRQSSSMRVPFSVG